MTVVLDTNVLISALINPGPARSLVYQLIKTSVNIAISDYIIAETEAVLRRSKFRRRQILTQIWQELKPVLTVAAVNKKAISAKFLRDPKDHPILVTAQKTNADYLITGDDDLLTLKNWQRVKIITIRQSQTILADLKNLPKSN